MLSSVEKDENDGQNDINLCYLEKISNKNRSSYLKGFSHRKLTFDMLFPLKSYAKKSFTV